MPVRETPSFSGRERISWTQRFINVFFSLVLDERNNRAKVTNCQSPLSPTQVFDLRRQRQLSDRPLGHNDPIFLFLEFVNCRRDAPRE